VGPATGRVLLLGLPLVGAHVALLALGDLARHLEIALGLWALAFLALARAARGLEKAGESLSSRPVAVGILAVALLLRLLLLPLAPTLSNDVDRYLWDGRVVGAGFNPYLLAPDAEELTSLRDERWQRLDHTEVPTVYPPLALATFALAAHLPAPLLAWKGWLIAADLAACWWLLALARQRGLAAGAVVAYAWNPLVVLEVAGMGHVDALGTAAVLGAVVALGARRPIAAGLGTAAGILAKLGPLAVLPAWTAHLFRRDPERAPGGSGARQAGLFLAIAVGAAALASMPVLVASGGIPPGLVTYGVSWEWNGPLYEPLWRLLDTAGTDAWLARSLDQMKSWSGHHEFWNRIYPYLYPQFLARVVLGLGMLTVVALSVRAGMRTGMRTGNLPGTTRRLFGGLLLLSATVYPWYLLWVLPWAALTRRGPWLFLSASILLTYLPQFRAVPLFPWIFALVWLPPLGAALLSHIRSFRPEA